VHPERAGGLHVHPPLGKWAIGWDAACSGVNEFGWRFAAARAGRYGGVLVRVTRRMTGSTVLAAWPAAAALTGCTSCRAGSRC
jgi:dolichyl-phosphate-mannose--protein O-mannosyl transferase